MYYKIFKISEGISLIHEIYVANFMRCNIWHVRGKEFDLIIDTGMGLSSLKKFIIDEIDKPIISVITHSHFDHCGSLHEFENRLGHKSEAKIIQNMRNEDIVFSGAWKEIQIIDKVKFPNYEGNTFHVTPTTLTGFLDEGDVIDLGNRTFKILHLPGHSPGSIGLLDTKSKELFSGDALYDGELLDEFYHSDKTLFKKTLNRLKNLDVEIFHGGHFPSFNKKRAHKIIETYLSGSNTIKDVSKWFKDSQSKGKQIFSDQDWTLAKSIISQNENKLSY